MFNSAFDGFKYQGDFGLFKAEKNILFQASISVKYFFKHLIWP